MDRINKAIPLREQVYNALRAELFKGTFTPGQRITEQEIAVSLGVSRTPVREALNLFRKQGVLEQQHGGGYVFYSPSVSQVEDIFEIRRALEPLAARKAVLNCKDSDIACLENLIQEEEKLIDEKDSTQAYLRNAEFRRIFFHLCANERLANTIDEFAGHILFHGILTLKDRSTRQALIHAQTSIVESLKTGDEEKMEKVIMDYLQSSHDVIMAALKN